MATKRKTKMDKCRTFLRNHKGLTRRIVLRSFMRRADLTEAAASTYFQMLRHEMNYG